MGISWKLGQPESVSSQGAPETDRPIPAAPSSEHAARIHAMPEPAEQATVGKGLVFNGAITGTGSLFVDGEVVGNINLPDSRVTVGPNGRVSDGLSVCINAREIVIMGKIRGNILASDRVEIRSEGWLTGNVSTGRISIAEGAFFKGDIDLRTPQPKSETLDVQQEQKKFYA